MSKQFEFECNGHNSIYTENYLKNNYEKRKFKVYFSVPDNDVNTETGILLFITGFGASSQSNIYKKMRKDFADDYNLVTIQCDYFGSEFMQNDVPMNLTHESLDILSHLELVINDTNTLNYNKLEHFDKRLELSNIVKFNESSDNFCDMSYMQAIDNITAVLNVISILYNNNCLFNTNKIMIMGQSQGAYLAYLSNVMCSGLFTHILDNSSWCYPIYLDTDIRKLYTNLPLNYNITFCNEFLYFAKNINLNCEYLKLSNLYKTVKNTCSIISYHGISDVFSSLEEKIEQTKDIDNIEINVVSYGSLKDGVFSKTSHGLGADFNKLFHNFYTKNVTNIEMSNILNFENRTILNGSNLEIDYSTGLPVVVTFDNLFKKTTVSKI